MAPATTIPVPNVPIHPDHKSLFTSINTFVHAYMSQPGHDCSHDYAHILRVLSNANTLYHEEQKANPSLTYDSSAIYLAALLHDVGDHKYAKANEDVENQVANLLRERGASEDLAIKVQTIVKHVGYTNEIRDPQSVVDVLAKYPELAIVQDADRLDAIGAVGVARCFAYNSAKGYSLENALDHFEEKLVKLPGMMKTKTGAKMAARNQILIELSKHFKEEANLSFALE